VQRLNDVFLLQKKTAQPCSEVFETREMTVQPASDIFAPPKKPMIRVISSVGALKKTAETRRGMRVFARRQPRAGSPHVLFIDSCDDALESRGKMMDSFRMHLPKTKGPSGNHDKEGQATVASFRTWRGLPAFNPWPLTENAEAAMSGPMTQNEKCGRFHRNPLLIKMAAA
jgi:hypothetical protein